MATPITEKDLTIEFLKWDDAHPDEWCVLHRGRILARHPELDTAIIAARVVMRVERCAGWVIPATGAAPIAIPA